MLSDFGCDVFFYSAVGEFTLKFLVLEDHNCLSFVPGFRLSAESLVALTVNLIHCGVTSRVLDSASCRRRCTRRRKRSCESVELGESVAVFCYKHEVL